MHLLFYPLLAGFLSAQAPLATSDQAGAVSLQQTGIASWYGEAHRGQSMANGKPFDPGKLTAASWFYPLGSRLKVSLAAPPDLGPTRTVYVTVSDRGPAKHLVRHGRVIDLSQAAFKALADPDQGLVPVTISAVANASLSYPEVARDCVLGALP